MFVRSAGIGLINLFAESFPEEIRQRSGSKFAGFDLKSEVMSLNEFLDSIEAY